MRRVFTRPVREVFNESLNLGERPIEPSDHDIARLTDPAAHQVGYVIVILNKEC